MQKKKRIVKIDWVDSCEFGGWQDDINDMKPCSCTTIGYLLKECKTHVVLAASASGTSFCSHMTIPKGCIVKITDLKETE
jgi:hypothetical protein